MGVCVDGEEFSGGTKMKFAKFDSPYFRNGVGPIRCMKTALLGFFLSFGIIYSIFAAEAPQAVVEEAAVGGAGGKPDKELPGKGGGSSATASATAGGGDATSALLEGRAIPITSVENSGAGVYRIPIVVPPGTNGVQPNLSLVYNSQSQQNGLLGIHWKLTGLSTIERCPRTVACPNKQ
jgi:hypothetical protein